MDTKFQWSPQCQAVFEHHRKVSCKEPILHYPNTEKPYILFTDTSCYAHSGVPTQAVDSPDDLRPIAFTSGSFSDMQQRGSATEKETFAVYTSILKFDLSLRRAECILHCNHKLLEPFLSKGIKIPRLNRCSVEMADCNIAFFHIKGKNYVLLDVISRLKCYIFTKKQWRIQNY